VSKEQVKPPGVPRKHRLRAKRKLDIILDVRPKLRQLVEEYQRLIRKKMNASSKLGTKNIRSSQIQGELGMQDLELFLNI